MTQSHRPVGPGDHVFLVDGSSFVFRAYFQSIRQDQKYNYRSDRLPVGAVRLFATKMLQFMRDGAAGIKPTHLAIIFDKSENSFRREIYPALQGAPARAAGRPRAAIPADARHGARLRPDADRAGPLRGRRPHRDLCAAGARARRGRADRLRRQGPDAARSSPGVAMYDPASGGDRARSGASAPDEVVAYFGVRRRTRSIDIQALAGDSTDNVPGAPGIGVKTAAQLIAEYGDLETLLARAGEIKQPKRRETLTNPETVALIRISKTTRDAGARRRTARCRSTRWACRSRRASGSSPSSRRWNSRRSPGASARSAASTPTTIEADPAFRRRRPAGAAATAKRSRRPRRRRPPRPPRRAGDADDADAAAPRRGARRAAREAETIRRRRLCDRAHRAPSSTRWIDARVRGRRRRVRHRDDLARSDPGRSRRRFASRRAGRRLLHPDRPSRRGAGDLFGGGGLCPASSPRREALALLKPLLEAPGVLKIAQNVKFDWHDVRAARHRGRAVRRHDADVLRARSGGRQRRPRHGRALRALARPQDRSRSPRSPARAAPSSASRARRSTRRPNMPPRTPTSRLRLWRVLKPRLVAEGMTTVYETLERPLIVAAGADGAARHRDRPRHSLAAVGRIRARHGAARGGDSDARRRAVQSRLAQSSSATSCSARWACPAARRRATGAWSTSASVLDDLAEEGHELPARILDWRQLSKLKSTYTDALPELRQSDARIASTPPTRWPRRRPGGSPRPIRTCRTFPIRNEEGRKIRRAFVAGAGPQADLGRLQPDRAAPARPYRRYRRS